VGKYYACFSCEVESKLQHTGGQIGIDLGITHLAIASESKFHANPKYLRKSERQLKRLQRIVPRRKKGSNRRKKAVLLLAKKHEYIANQRKGTAQKVSRQLIIAYDLIAFEDLNIKGMVRNHHLAKSIADSGWKLLIQYTQYKAEYAGKRVVLVNPHNTSQM
jgi:putative transposase